MHYILEKEEDNIKILPAKVIDPEKIKAATSPLAWKILKLLSENASYAKELGRKLKMHEQKIYYHVRKLEKAGLIKVVREDRIQGALTKFYSITEPAIALVLKEMEPAEKLFSMKQAYREFLEPFIANGRFDALIVIGHYEPHGPTKEIAHDATNAANLALFFGTFLNHIPQESIKFDTEIKEEDLKKNLIIIGGPGVNSVMAKINEKLPIRFQKVKYKHNFYQSFYSDISKKTYSDDSYGIIVKAKNPFDKTKQVLVIAGRRFGGTKAAVLAFINKTDELCQGNSYNRGIYARVIDGLDLDSDGIVDSVEFIE